MTALSRQNVKLRLDQSALTPDARVAVSSAQSGPLRRTNLSRVLVSAAIMAVSGALVMSFAQDAKACGGCFHQENESTVVTDHRMAFSISKTQTVLWDQIRYQGAPQEFAWVLPVREGARVELSNRAWIATLDALTQPQIVAPFRPGPSGGGGGIGCSSADSAGSFSSSAKNGGTVQVVSEAVVGPYQTVILRSKDPLALENWLLQNKFQIQESVKPIIAQYVREGLDFLALRLRPGASVRAMEPIRVITPGADVSLPLRMVAAGIGNNVGLTLFVLGEGRYQTANFPNTSIDVKKLFWNFTTSRSNYQELSFDAMAENAGTSWLSEAALPRISTQLKQLYQTALTQDGPQPFPEPEPPTPPEPVDAGASSNDGGGGAVDASVGARSSDDFEVATRGMSLDSVWVTRLRANLPASALAKDLKLEASPTQSALSAQYLARDPDPQAGQSQLSPTAPKQLGSTMLLVLTVGWLAVRLRRKNEQVS
jgi:hypothetical protein